MNTHETQDALKLALGIGVLGALSGVLFFLLVRYFQGARFVKDAVQWLVSS